MKIYTSVFKKYRTIGVLLFCILFSGTIKAHNDDDKKPKEISGNQKVTVESGTSRLLLDNTVTLNNSDTAKYDDYLVPLPFQTLKKRNLTGSAKVISGNWLEKYPSTDLRNAFAGIKGLDVREYHGTAGVHSEETTGRYGITTKVSVQSRQSNMMYVIDGMPVDYTEMPMMAFEIESVTFSNDIVAKSMLGPEAANGIIYITTRRGNQEKQGLNVSIENGVSVIDRMPKFVSGANYAWLNNNARANEGLAALYSDADIAAYARNDPYDMYHPSVDFRDMVLKNTKAFRRANISRYGGNDMIQYNAMVGYNGEGDIFKIGSVSDYNQVSVRSNMDIRINDFLKIKLNLLGSISHHRSPNYGYATAESSGLTDIFEGNSVINDLNTIPPIAFPVYANNDPKLEYPWYGVSNSYQRNPIGSMVKNGSYKESGKYAISNLVIEYDFSKFIEGLKSTTYAGFMIHSLMRIGQSENYSGYIVTPGKTASGADTIRLSRVFAGVETADIYRLHDYYFNRIVISENLNYEKSFGENSLQASASWYITSIVKDMAGTRMRVQNANLSALYSHNGRYNLHGVINYSGNPDKKPGQMYSFFPSIGASWVISEEDFMSTASFINYLKLRAEAGILGYNELIGPYYWRDKWSTGGGSVFGPYTSGQWFGSQQDSKIYSTTKSRTGNPDLDFEKRKEVNFGLDALILNEKLSLEVTYYNHLREGIPVQVSNVLPLMAAVSNSLPRLNNDSYRYHGVETGFQYTDNSKEFKYSLGGSLTIQNSKIEKYDEPKYNESEAYRFRAGQAADAIWGQHYLGRFASDAEALVIRQMYDAVLLKGDLKYFDKNGDKIVDEKDVHIIGHSSPRLYYGLNADFGFKNFQLTVIGAGRALYDLPLTGRYHQNGWGTNTYSEFVRNNIDGAYPRLTYTKVNNNFVNSEFWLTDGGYFKIQNVELAYKLSADKKIIGAESIVIYVRGANLFTFTKVKDVDPESINSGVTMYPLFRTFSGGINLTF